MITLVHMIHYYSHLEDGKISVYVIEFVWSSKDKVDLVIPWSGFIKIDKMRIYLDVTWSLMSHWKLGESGYLITYHSLMS
jgi:hypothetical protein